MLKLIDIKKNYLSGENEIKALKGVSIEFRENEFVSILGQSGCGKTTLLNIIGGLDRYSSGDLIINRKSTKEFKDRDWDTYRNHSIGFVFQSYNLISHLTVLGNVELALTLSGVSSQERKRRAIEALEKVGLKDQINKKPNQMSGGQMQRVAIARALINNPDILLADEPTGALDSETSVQIMEILKEIAKEKLVIMVTHNPELADKYSSRIIRLLDGEVLSDSNPFKLEDSVVITEKNKDRTSMPFFMALALSAKNLITKKGRTILTSFAGSIGIIGIALVLALSNGFQNYIDKFQSDTLSSYPLTISETSIDYSAMMQMNPNNTSNTLFDKIYINALVSKMATLLVSNNITNEYVDGALKTIDQSLLNGISYDYGVSLNAYSESFSLSNPLGEKTYNRLSPEGPQGMNVALWQELIDNEEFLKSQYDIIEGKMPNNKNEIVLVLDKYNRVTDLALLNALGVVDVRIAQAMAGADVDISDISYEYSDFLGRKFSVLNNNQAYYKNGTAYKTYDKVSKDVYDAGTMLEIVGIIKPNEQTQIGSIGDYSVIGYHSDLIPFLMNEEKTNPSEVVQYQLANPTINCFTGSEFSTAAESAENQARDNLRVLGTVNTPSVINIYPVDFNAKQVIKDHLNQYNKDNFTSEEDYIEYADVMEVFVGAMNTVINSISYVLIAFTSVSLVVSSIMIGIITYVSVIERTKEIGILRAVGARKKDISRVFNAETFIIGLSAGLIGVIFTYIASLPINIILKNLVDVDNIANLSPIAALILILISIFLTLVAGLIPSRMAAKKDPVVALRTE